MAAPLGNKNAVGNSGGKSRQDRILAAEVMTMGLLKVKKIFEMPVVEMSDREKELHDQLLLRIVPSLLPRLSEVTGNEGGAVQVDILSQADKEKLDAILNNSSL